VRSDLRGPQEGKPVRRPTQTDHFSTGSQTMRQAPGVPMPVLVDDLAARRLQGIELQDQGLIVRGDAGIADFVHGWNYARGLLRGPALFGSRTYRRGLDRAKGVRFARSVLSSGLVLVTVAVMKVGIVRMLVPPAPAVGSSRRHGESATSEGAVQKLRDSCTAVRTMVAEGA
jgi:hypothetical protein